MISPAVKLEASLTYEEYLAVEREMDSRFEYLDGAIRLMVGASKAHGRITVAMIRALGNRLKGGPCRVVEGQTRLRVDRMNSSYYPDVMVYCEAARETDSHAVLHPSLIVEVLSDTTASIDRNEKAKVYKTIASLRYYLIVDPAGRVINVWSRSDGEWHGKMGQMAVDLPDLDISFPADEVLTEIDD
jgi:Uma2 family endonuclease